MSRSQWCRTFSQIQQASSLHFSCRTTTTASIPSHENAPSYGDACVLMAVAVPYALAQDAPARQLERVEINAPEQRTRSRAASAGQGPGYGEATQPDQSSWDPQAGTSGTASGQSLIPSSSLSVVTDKSSVSSVGAAALPSQVTVVTRQEIDRLDVRNYTDLFRTVPGVRAYSYGQGDVGHPMQIRGNSGGHGVDTCIYVDGVPAEFPVRFAGWKRHVRYILAQSRND